MQEVFVGLQEKYKLSRYLPLGKKPQMGLGVYIDKVPNGYKH